MMRTPYFFTTKQCPYCGWLFQCPLGDAEQEQRIACRACESKLEDKYGETRHGDA